MKLRDLDMQFMVLKIYYDTVKLQKVTLRRYRYLLYYVIKITSSKICHLNEVTKFFHFQDPPLAKSGCVLDHDPITQF